MGFVEFARSILPELIAATGTTLELTVCAIALGFGVGVTLALLRVYGAKPLRVAAGAYIHFFRGTPLLAQLLLVYYGLPPYLSMVGIRLSPLVAAVIGLGLNSAAYQAEYFRGAIQSIESGQMLAARAVGMSRLKAVRYIIMPQALRLVVPAWSNELIYSIKYSSLAYFLTLKELTFVGKRLAMRSARTFEVYLVVAAIYLVIVVIVSRLLALLERRVSVPGLGAGRGRR